MGSLRIAVILTALVVMLTSCEGFIRLQGHVVDTATKKPVENVKVVLILQGRDTVEDSKLYYDTVPYNDRLALRKKGVKDDYAMYDARGLSKRGPSFTDTAGYFSIGNLLVGCVPKCPTCQLLFVKEGYEPVVVKLPSIGQDSIIVALSGKSGK